MSKLSSLSAVCNYYSLWERYHPEYTEDENRDYFCALLMCLSPEEKQKAHRYVEALKEGPLVDKWKALNPEAFPEPIPDPWL
jgi:hypothetical protein